LLQALCPAILDKERRLAKPRGRIRRIPYASNPIIYRLLQWTISVLVRILYRYRVHGRENLPKNGSAMLVVNHLHLLDPIVVAAGVGRQVVTLVAEKWRENRLVGLFLKGAGVIFVNRGEVDRRALRACQQVLEAGGMLAVAPEGTRSRQGVLQRAKPGVAYLATRTNALIVPVAFWGVEKLREWKGLRRPTCHLVIGEPFHLPEVEGRLTTERLQELADLVMLRIAALLPENYRGFYAPLLQAEADTDAEHMVVPA
jgi:1-acyl-sn-glycerol-3-phosphate acyltransferase